MTRYMITFRSVGTQKVNKKVPQQVGEYVVQCLATNKNVVINGDFFSVADIESVKKINVGNGFSKDYCEQENRKELANESERLYLQSTKLLQS